jgi:hypothetical protein
MILQLYLKSRLTCAVITKKFMMQSAADAADEETVRESIKNASVSWTHLDMDHVLPTTVQSDLIPSPTKKKRKVQTAE